MVTRKPCEARNSANHPPILPWPPITNARLPVPWPCAATRACSCVASDDWMSCRSSDSARSGLSPKRCGGVAAAQNHLPLARKVAGGSPGGALDGRHLFAERLPASDQIEQLGVELGESGAQFVQIHHEVQSRMGISPSLLLAGGGYRKCDGTATILS